MIWHVRGGVGGEGGFHFIVHFWLHLIFLTFFSCDTEKLKSQSEEMEQEKAELELQIKTSQGELYR